MCDIFTAPTKTRCSSVHSGKRMYLYHIILTAAEKVMIITGLKKDPTPTLNGFNIKKVSAC